MSQLPKGWYYCSPSELASDPKNDIVDGPFGSNLKASEYTDEGTPIVRIQNVKRMHFVDKNIKYMTNEKAEFLKRHSFKSGDLLITKLGEPLGLTCIAPSALESGIIVADIVRFRPHESVNRKCLAYLLNSEQVIGQIKEHTKGSTRARINLSVVRNLSIALPPEAEQTRIVEKLDEVLAQVDTIKARLDGIPAILKRFRQSVLAAAVSGKLTEEWRGNAEYSDSKNQLVPSTWEVRAAKDICVKVQSGSTPRNDPFNQNGTIPFLKVYNIVNQKIDFDYKPQFITSDTHSETLKRSVAYPGDVLMNIVGPPLGKVAILTEQYPEWNLNQAITLFRANEEILLNKYLYFVLCEGELVRAVMPETKGSVGQVNISLSQCRDSLIPLPPLEEQKEIVRLVDQYFAFADTIEAQVKKAQARVDKLTQSILAKAFRGELVPQDPSDEPADKLLERIAAARKEAEALAKAAKKATNL
ncbi:restriction endonuclease subunit S [Vibrio cholerae]|nr:hypothetical protein [Vibrio cholerae]EIA0775956.1 restriction endonuclease subunit S [Vibrio cholerae]ELG5194835.1 restriction endonuclease subunit S [Vibrio cholerae]